MSPKTRFISLICLGLAAALSAALVIRAALRAMPDQPSPAEARLPAAALRAAPDVTGAAEAAWRQFSAYKLALPERPAEISLLAVGDIMLSRTVGSRIKAHGADYPFLKTAAVIRAADIAFANLESPITAGREIKPGEMMFRSDVGSGDSLKRAGFDVVSLANNHTPNFGERGLADTLRLLDAAGVKHAGAGLDETSAREPAWVEAGGLKFAFLAYNDASVVPADYQAASDRSGTAFMDLENLARDVAAAGSRADVVIVSMHAGSEYTAEPGRSQTTFARAAIDAGADLVIGHHPHVVQTVEKYRGKFILYSLGNFVFDQAWSRETQDGLAARIIFRGDQVERIDLLPVTIEDSAQPALAAGEASRRILARLRADTRQRSVFVPDAAAGGWKQENREYLTGDVRSAESRSIKTLSADVDADLRLETFVLRDGRLDVNGGDGEVWRSPSAWWVDDAALADVDGDGAIEICLSVWKVGSFGQIRPFWLDGDTPSVNNHLFVFNYDGGRMAPKWQSSALPRPNCEALFVDVDGDGRSELAALEGDYAAGRRCLGRQVAVWKWGEWGFANVWRGPRGEYSGLIADPAAGGPAISAYFQAENAGQPTP